MTIQMQCQNCKTPQTIDASMAGKNVECTNCRTLIRIPSTIVADMQQASVSEAQEVPGSEEVLLSEEVLASEEVLEPGNSGIIRAALVGADFPSAKDEPVSFEPTEPKETAESVDHNKPIPVAKVVEVEVESVEPAESTSPTTLPPDREIPVQVEVIGKSNAAAAKPFSPDVPVPVMPAAAAKGTSQPVADKIVVTDVIEVFDDEATSSANSLPTAKSQGTRAAFHAVSTEEILNAIQSEIETVPTSIAYRVSAFFVAVLMVLLPLLYVFAIGAVIVLVAWHATTNFGVVNTGRSARSSGAAFVFLYVGPLVVGLLTVVFMIKPLFARRAKSAKPRSLTREQEPRLFAFVDRLCAAVHAPKPKRIDVDCQVNASASFRNGLLSMFMGNDLVLTIGMPLVAGMSTRQLAGVLAHEFGHFSQGFGMRVSYVVRVISYWLARVVYERDRWDEWLAGTASSIDIRLGIVLHLARLQIWLTRRLLWLLMMLGNLCSCLLLRQMEFDADLHEIRFSGSDSFRKSTMQLRRLGMAFQEAVGDQQGFFMDGKLGNNMPMLTSMNRDAQTEAEVRKMFAGVMEEKTELLATHPVDRERVAQAKDENEPGVFRLELPASALFSGYERICEAVTYDFFKEIFEDGLKPNMLVPSEQLVAHKSAAREASQTLRRMFGAYFRVPRSMRFDYASDPGASVTELVERLKESRKSMQSSLDVYSSTSKQFDAADSKWLLCHQAMALQDLSVPLKQADFKVPVTSRMETKRASERFRMELSQTSEHLKPHEAAFEQRVSYALQLAIGQAMQSRLGAGRSDAIIQEANWTCGALGTVQAAYADVVQFRNEYSAFSLMLQIVAGSEVTEDVVTQITTLAEKLSVRLHQYADRFRDSMFPFDHADGAITLTKYLVPKVPKARELGEVVEAGSQFLQQYHYLYFRCIGELCVLCQEVESGLGWPKQPIPPEAEDEQA
ncbi:MAG: M48 family metalloprotease [Planctomycetota bacterium]